MNRDVRLQSYEKATGWCTAHCKMLLFVWKPSWKSCMFWTSPSEEEGEEEEERGCLVTFWFGAMFFAPVGVLFIMCGVCSSSPQLAGLFHTKVFTQGYITSCQNYPRLLDHGTSQEKLTPIHCTTDNCTCISQNYLHSYFVGQYCTCLYIYKNKKH